MENMTPEPGYWQITPIAPEVRGALFQHEITDGSLSRFENGRTGLDYLRRPCALKPGSHGRCRGLFACKTTTTACSASAQLSPSSEVSG